MELCSCFTIRWWLLILLTPLLMTHEPHFALVSSATSSYGAQDFSDDVTKQSSDDVMTQSSDVTTMTCDNVTVTNGAVYLTRDDQLKHRIIVECYEGFQLQGNSQLQCSDTEDITSMLPTCAEVVKCEVVCGIDHGTCVKHTTGTLVNPGVEVTYSCDETFAFSTTYTTVTCTEQNGSFNNPSPTCVRKWQGSTCTLTESEAISNFIKPSAAQTIQRGETIQVECQHGYYPREHNGPVSLKCSDDGAFDRDHKGLCTFVGVDLSLEYTANQIIKQSEERIYMDQGVEVSLKCTAYSLTNDGLPLPEITWQSPTKLVMKTTDSNGATSVSYIEGVKTEYKVAYKYDTTTKGYIHQAEATLTISSTMEVHSGTYSCLVKLVDFSQSKSKTVQIKGDFTPAMWLLLILPVVMFVAVHCFYRKAIRNGRNPFHSPNKMAQDIMQEVDRKKKLEELNLQYYSSGGKNIKQTSETTANKAPPIRGRRGAVIDV